MNRSPSKLNRNNHNLLLRAMPLAKIFEILLRAATNMSRELSLGLS